MDHQGGDCGEEEHQQQLDDHRDEQYHELLELEAQLGDRRRSLSLEIDRESPLPKQQQSSSSSSWRAAAASFRESLSRSLSLNQLQHEHRQDKDDDEVALRWAAVERLPTLDRLHTSLLLHTDHDGQDQVQVVDVRRLGAAERRKVVDTLITDIQRDNLRLLRKQRQRMDRVGVRPPTVEVRWRDVCVEAECQVVQGKPLPTIWNAVVSSLSVCSAMLGLSRSRQQASRIRILSGVSGVVKPSRLTLLLGPPGCGKTTLLKALAGKLNNNNASLRVTGEIEYNGVDLKDFVPEKTAAYIDQYDLHVPEMTVRETIDFSARFQGVGNRAGY
jgi:ABC-type multidrug transport system fused ATPase/permease subunit